MFIWVQRNVNTLGIILGRSLSKFAFCYDNEHHGQKQLAVVRVGTQTEPWEGNGSRCHGGLGLLPGALWLVFCSRLPNHSSVQENASPGVPVVPFSQMCQVAARLLSTITVFKLKSKLVVEGLKTELLCSGNWSCGSSLPGTLLFCPVDLAGSGASHSLSDEYITSVAPKWKVCKCWMYGHCNNFNLRA